MNSMDDLVYNPLTGMFESRNGATRPNPNLEGQPTWNPRTSRGVSTYTPPPTINTFRRRGNPVVGQKCRFFWSVTNATHLHISGLGEVPVVNNGECEVWMTSNYQQVKLTASNGGGSTTRTLNVYPMGNINDIPLPIVHYFRKTGDGVGVGDEVVLEWDVTGAKDVYLEGPRTMHVEHHGTSHIKIENPARTYRLRAVNSVNKEVYHEIKVDVDGTRIPKPVINNMTYEVMSPPLSIGDEILVNWSVIGAQSVSLKRENGASIDVKPVGNKKIKIQSIQTTITLLAKNYPHETIETITVEALPLPEIRDFHADCHVCKKGDSVVLSWETVNAEQVTINGEEVEVVGSKLMVMLAENNEIEMVAATGGRSVEKKLIIKAVDNPAPKIVSFGYPANASRHKGDNILLSWVTENAERVELQFGKRKEEQRTTGSRYFKIIKSKCTVKLIAYNGKYSTSAELVIEMQKTFFQKLFG